MKPFNTSHSQFRSLALTFGSTVAITFANTLSGILTARVLGPSGKGELTAVMLWPNVLAAVGNLGLVEAIAYFAGKDRSENIPSVLSTGWVIALVQALILIPIGFFTIPSLMQQYSPSAVWTARIFLLFIPFNLVILYNRSVFHGRGLMTIYNFITLFVNYGYVAFIILLAVIGHLTVLTCTLALLVVHAFLLAFEMYWLNRMKWLHIAAISPIRQYFTYGVKAHIGNISSLLNLRLDQMLMAAILPSDVLGLYVVAVTLSNAVGLFSSAVSAVSFPVILSGKSDIQAKSLAKYMRLNFGATVILAIAMVLLAPSLIRILFGQSYIGSVLTCQILCLAAVFSSMAAVLKSGLKGLGKPLISTYGELIGLIGTALLLFTLLPSWRILGAAIASLVAYMFSFAYMFAYICKELNIRPYLFLLPQTEDKKEVIAYTKLALSWVTRSNIS